MGWEWGGGRLDSLGFSDFAGSTLVHASASDAADSVKKLRKVAKDYDAKVVWGHDPVTWLDWKKAPMFYYD